MPQRPKIANNMLELIGYTPLVRLNKIPAPASAELLVKLESQNPMDSVKDRIGAAMIEAAERAGRIAGFPASSIIPRILKSTAGPRRKKSGKTPMDVLTVSFPEWEPEGQS